MLLAKDNRYHSFFLYTTIHRLAHTAHDGARRNALPAVKIVRQLRQVRVGQRMVDVMPRGDLWLGRDGRGKRNDFQNSNGFSPFFNSFEPLCFYLFFCKTGTYIKY
jgi:hypothetical protein